MAVVAAASQAPSMDDPKSPYAARGDAGAAVLVEAGLKKQQDRHSGFNRPRARTDLQVNARSVVASSQVKIRAYHDPTSESSQWDATRDRYLSKKEKQLSLHLNHAVKSLSSLLQELRDFVRSINATFPLDDVYHFSEHMFRTNTLLTRISQSIKSSSFPQRRAKFLRHVDLPLAFDTFDEGIEPSGAAGSTSEEEELVEGWIEDAKKVMLETVDELCAGNQQLEHWLLLVEGTAGQPAPEGPSPDPFLVRSADVAACTNLATLMSSLELEMKAIRKGASFENSGEALQLLNQPPLGWALSNDHPIHCVSSLIDPSVDSLDIIRAAALYLTPVVYGKDCPVIREGTVGMSMYFIKEGIGSITVNGREVNKRHKGEFFGELALTTNAQRKADVWAVDDDLELFELTRESFESMCSAYPIFMERVANVGQQRASSHGWGFKRTGGKAGAARRDAWQQEKKEAKGKGRGPVHQSSSDRGHSSDDTHCTGDRFESVPSSESDGGEGSFVSRTGEAEATRASSSSSSSESRTASQGSMRSADRELSGYLAGGSSQIFERMDSIDSEGGSSDGDAGQSIVDQARAQVPHIDTKQLSGDSKGSWSPPPSDWGRAFEVYGWGEACDLNPTETFAGEPAEEIMAACVKVLKEIQTFGSPDSNQGSPLEARVLARELMSSISGMFRRQRLKKGDEIVCAGTHGGCLWLVEEGVIERTLATGEVYDHGAGSFLGVVVTFVCGTWQHTISVKSDTCCVLALNAEDLLYLLMQHKLMTQVLTEVGKMQLTKPYHQSTKPSLEAHRRLSTDG